MIKINLSILVNVGEDGFEYESFVNFKKLSRDQQLGLLNHGHIPGKFEIVRDNEIFGLPMDDLGYVFDIFFEMIKEKLSHQHEEIVEMWLSELDTLKICEIEKNIIIEQFLYPNQIEKRNPCDLSICLDRNAFWKALQEAAPAFLEFVDEVVPKPENYHWKKYLGQSLDG